MDATFVLNVFDAAIILGTLVPVTIMAARIPKRPLRILSLLLSSFFLVHGFYHLAEGVATLPGYDIWGSLSDVFIEPAGWILLFAFMVYFTRRGG